jgi:hypothetical protein
MSDELVATPLAGLVDTDEVIASGTEPCRFHGQ